MPTTPTWHLPLMTALLALGCRADGCGRGHSELLDPSGSWGHETLELTVAASEDRAVISLASLFDGGNEQCACLLHMRADGPGRWTSFAPADSVELFVEGDELMIRPTHGERSLPCCSAPWSGDRAPLASHRSLGSCRVLAPETVVSLPDPDFDEPGEGDFLAYQGDIIEGTPLWGAIDEWVVGRRMGPEPWAALVPIADLVCAPAGEELPPED